MTDTTARPDHRRRSALAVVAGVVSGAVGLVVGYLGGTATRTLLVAALTLVATAALARQGSSWRPFLLGVAAGAALVVVAVYYLVVVIIHPE